MKKLSKKQKLIITSFFMILIIICSILIIKEFSNEHVRMQANRVIEDSLLEALKQADFHGLWLIFVTDGNTGKRISISIDHIIEVDEFIERCQGLTRTTKAFITNENMPVELLSITNVTPENVLIYSFETKDFVIGELTTISTNTVIQINLINN